jgi:hypothetical protein
MVEKNNCQNLLVSKDSIDFRFFKFFHFLL